jgi:hypothetical protein
MKSITGTFIDEITCDIPSQNWGKEEWKQEFDSMKEAGIDTVILIRAGYREMWAYKSEVVASYGWADLADFLLDQSDRCGIKFFFGCYDSGKIDHTCSGWEADWEINKKAIPEIQQRFGSHPAFQGWYLSPETCLATKGSLEIFRRYSDLMKEMSPEKPVLISPYYPSWAYVSDPKETRHSKFIEEWYQILSKSPNIDIVAFQDGSCNFNNPGYPFSELEDYIKETHALLKDLKITQWNNVECFGRDLPIKFPPIDWRILKKKMEIADPYVEKQITFEFSHFMSPNSTWPSARNLYKRYKEEILGLK